MNADGISSIGLVGAGLIGGSLAACLARRLPGAALRVFDASAGNAAYVAERHPRGQTVAALEELGGCDIVFVATPVATIPGQVAALLALEKSDAVIVDTGSAKAAIMRDLAETGADRSRFVPGHPLAGGVSTGPGRSRADIIASRPFVLTPDAATGEEALEAATALLERLGAMVVTMGAEEHDRLLAHGSHLPHLIAFALADFAEEETAALLPASFRAIAAFAASDAQMWADIFRANSEDLKEAAEKFKKRLDLIVAMADEPTPGALLDLLDEARARIDALEDLP